MNAPRVVFLFDVDNTLLDHDRVVSDVRHFMEREIGVDRQQRYWEILETLRAVVPALRTPAGARQ